MMSFLADDSGSRSQAAAAADIVRDVLGPAALAGYLYGSAVAGGLRPSSDLDILVVSSRSLSADERAQIMRRLLPLSGRSAVGGPARPIELSIIARPSLVPWRYPPGIELQYGEWMRAAVERDELPDWPHPDPDVAVLIETAHRASVPLFGPRLETVIGRVPRFDLVRAMLDLIPVLMPGIEQGDDIRNGLLTLARIWMTVATDEVRPKDEAAAWALARLPVAFRAPLAHARMVYLGDETEDWRELKADARPCVDYAVGEIRKLTTQA